MPVKHYCKNNALDALLQFYTGHILQAGIDLRIDADLPQNLPVSESDLCVVLGNLIENAQEACDGQEAPRIHIAARVIGGCAITLIVDNTAPIAPKRHQDGTFVSSKHDGDGIGTQPVHYIARQYNGTVEFEWKDGMFCASVFLNSLDGALQAQVVHSSTVEM